MDILGSHLILPFISLVSSSKVTQTDLISAFPQLYKDLTSTPPESLLNLSTPAFRFISENRWKHCQLPSDLQEPTKQIIEENKGEVERLIKLLLPKLAEG